MLGENLSKSEIEEKIFGRGEFVQMDYLSKLLRQSLHRDTKKFIYLKLIEIYDKRKMYNDSAKMYDGLADISIAFSEKVKYFVKAVESYIKAGFFDKADYSLKRAYGEANSREREDISHHVKNFYKNLAENYKREVKRNHAVKVYLKLLEMNITDMERKEIKKKLIDLYEKLGKIKEFYALKRAEEREF